MSTFLFFSGFGLKRFGGALDARILGLEDLYRRPTVLKPGSPVLTSDVTLKPGTLVKLLSSTGYDVADSA
jgi:hypothetical protein